MRRITLALLASLALTSAAAHAQDSAAAPASDALDQKVAERLKQTREVYGPTEKKKTCAPSSAGELVVCADHGRDQRMPPTSQTDPNSLAARRALNNGIPRAPQLDKGYCPSCPHFGWAPPPVYYVDVSALPQAPEGSDADKIAKGEMPAP